MHHEADGRGRARSPPLRPRLAALVLALGVASAFLTNFCDLVYRCGCRAPWAGAAQACNIQQAGHPDCPWCSYGWWGLIVPLGAIATAQVLILLLPGRLGLIPRTAAALLAFPVVGGLVALIFGGLAGYWHHAG
jgi:hypothetical protein